MPARLDDSNYQQGGFRKPMTRMRAVRARIRVLWRHLQMKAMTPLLSRTVPAHAAIAWDERPYRVLFLRYEKTGDMLLTTGVIRAIAERHRKITFDMLAPPGAESLLEGNPYIRKVFTFRRDAPWRWPRLWRELRRQRYDVVIDGRINPENHYATTTMIMVMAGAAVRIGSEGHGRDRVYTHLVTVDRDAHFAVQSGAVLQPFGIDPATIDYTPVIVLRDEDRAHAHNHWRAAFGDEPKLRVVANVSVDNPRRYWPRARYVEVISALRERFPNAAVFVIGLPQDIDRAQAIATASGASYRPTRSVREAAGLVATADLLFTPDTGISHVASAFQTPVVVMMTSRPESFMVHSPDAYKPWNTPATIVRSPDLWLDELNTGEVIAALTNAVAQLHVNGKTAR